MSANGLFGSVRADFQLVGELVGKREITSDKMKDWKLFIWKIASRGSTFEVQVDRDTYDRGVIEGAYQIAGNLGVDGGRTKLVAADIKVIPSSRTSG